MTTRESVMFPAMLLTLLAGVAIFFSGASTIENTGEAGAGAMLGVWWVAVGNGFIFLGHAEDMNLNSVDKVFLAFIPWGLVIAVVEASNELNGILALAGSVIVGLVVVMAVMQYEDTRGRR